MVEQACFADIPAHELAEVLDIVLWDMSGDHPAELWLDELKARPDAATQPVQAAMAVIEDYLWRRAIMNVSTHNDALFPAHII
jgi:hypothetical protein